MKLSKNSIYSNIKNNKLVIKDNNSAKLVH